MLTYVDKKWSVPQPVRSPTTKEGYVKGDPRWGGVAEKGAKAEPPPPPIQGKAVSLVPQYTKKRNMFPYLIGHQPGPRHNGYPPTSKKKKVRTE